MTLLALRAISIETTSSAAPHVDVAASNVARSAGPLAGAETNARVAFTPRRAVALSISPATALTAAIDVT